MAGSLNERKMPKTDKESQNEKTSRTKDREEKTAAYNIMKKEREQLVGGNFFLQRSYYYYECKIENR